MLMHGGMQNIFSQVMRQAQANTKGKTEYTEVCDLSIDIGTSISIITRKRQAMVGRKQRKVLSILSLRSSEQL